MPLKFYLIALAASSVLCWSALILTVSGTNPNQGGQTALLAFYLSLSFALLSTLSLLGYGVRRYLSRNETKYEVIRTAFRQAFLVTGVLAAAGILQAVRLLSWWDVVLLLSIAMLLELYLRSYARPASL